MTEHPRHRPIRSYVRREGRMTPAQQRAFERLWSRYGVDPVPGTQLDLACLFGNRQPVTLEIGFGNGEALLEEATSHPDRNYLGIEVHRPGAGHLLLGLEHQDIGNVRILCTDAVEVLCDQLADASLAGLRLFFPDPWPKKKHHKRRLVQAAFAELLARKLYAGALVHMATDWEDYARQMLKVMESNPAFENLADSGAFADNPPPRTLTRFEARGRRLGHSVWDLVFRRHYT